MLTSRNNLHTTEFVKKKELTHHSFFEYLPKYYSGTEDGLIRCSAPMRKSNDTLHFVSVDFMNEYLTTLFGSGSSGKSLKSFVAAKNSLNCEQRGSTRLIDINQTFIAFHVYLNAIRYDPEIGYGCPQERHQ